MVKVYEKPEDGAVSLSYAVGKNMQLIGYIYIVFGFLDEVERAQLNTKVTHFDCLTTEEPDVPMDATQVIFVIYCQTTDQINNIISVRMA